MEGRGKDGMGSDRENSGLVRRVTETYKYMEGKKRAETDVLGVF